MEAQANANVWDTLAPETRRRIQRLLCVHHTGVFDTDTARNLRLWQAMAGIPCTGILDTWTHERMQTYIRGLTISHFRSTARGLWWDIDPVTTMSHMHQFADHLVLMGIDHVSLRIDHDTSLNDPGPHWTWSAKQIARFAFVLDRRDITVALAFTPLPAFVHMKHLIEGVNERTSHLVSILDLQFTPATLKLWGDPAGCGFDTTDDAANELVDRLPAIPLHVTSHTEPLEDPPKFWIMAEEVKYLSADTTPNQLSESIANAELPVWISSASSLFAQCDNHKPELERALKSTNRTLH